MTRREERLFLLFLAIVLPTVSAIATRQYVTATREIEALKAAVAARDHQVAMGLQVKRDLPRFEDEIRRCTAEVERLEQVLPVTLRLDSYLHEFRVRASAHRVNVEFPDCMNPTASTNQAEIEAVLHGGATDVSQFLSATENATRLTIIDDVQSAQSGARVKLRVFSGGSYPPPRDVFPCHDFRIPVWLPPFRAHARKLQSEYQGLCSDAQELAPFIHIAYVLEDRRNALRAKIDAINALLPEGKEPIPQPVFDLELNSQTN